MKFLILIAFLFFTVTARCQDLTRFVNPFIGTMIEGYTNPGATMPWGMSISPLNTYDTLNVEWAKPSPYMYGRKYISGFSHLNLSGTGCPELGTFTLMPTVGDLELNPGKYGSEYSEEIASPGYYSVMLDKYNVKAELSVTKRTSISRYTFPKGKSNILLNLELSLTQRNGATIHRVSDTEIEGFKSIGGMCGKTCAQTVYFVAVLSKKPDSCGVWNKEKRFPDFQRPMAGDNIGAYFMFNTEEGDEICVKVGTSYVSTENARANLEAEQPEFDFNQIKETAEKAWNDELSKIRVEGGTEDDKVMFYTALYHMLIHPTVFNDVNGEYPEFQGTRTLKADFDYYTTLSFWDTYRNVHPFLALVYPQQQLDMVKTMIAMYRESGWLPKQVFGGMEIYGMVGDPALIVIADTWLRGITDFNVELAYEAMKQHATTREDSNPIRPGFDNLLKYGYIPQDVVPQDKTDKHWIWGPVSTVQEYCIADWNLSQLAKSLEKTDDAEFFYKQSMLYKNYFDTTTNFIRPRLADGSWYKPFNPSKNGHSYHSQVGFVEGNSWHYTYMVPHDIPGLMKLMGGSENFIEKLNTCFDSAYFNLGNEPDMAYPYLFNYVKGEEWRTQEQVHKMICENFSNSPNGLPGNEDCGATSACLLFGMMGFYPTCPGDMDFQLASPVFDKITISLDLQFYPGKEFVIETKHTGRDNYLIKSMKLNGENYRKFSLNHYDITRGGKLEIKLKK